MRLGFSLSTALAALVAARRHCKLDGPEAHVISAHPVASTDASSEVALQNAPW
eukprot:CAMPEP_0115600904 /NCGR_PEP_ID=MMETSP0272-20121206/15126_1 /TAXON_ID=71861 /ORGANISM="Scrippsiella trochoidea, Strain CCMP3099" /LENGTH=52 /DNA_ID=CAMNT_0003036357 /DNA_START=407 /DNA_END=562 /DNA_ORIENTATION=-